MSSTFSIISVIVIFVAMKAARIITKANKQAKFHAKSSETSQPVLKRIASAKISAQTQFVRIKEALQEVELIEAGKIQPTSLKEALDEL